MGADALVPVDDGKSCKEAGGYSAGKTYAAGMAWAVNESLATCRRLALRVPPHVAVSIVRAVASDPIEET